MTHDSSSTWFPGHCLYNRPRKDQPVSIYCRCEKHICQVVIRSKIVPVNLWTIMFALSQLQRQLPSNQLQHLQEWLLQHLTASLYRVHCPLRNYRMSSSPFPYTLRILIAVDYKTWIHLTSVNHVASRAFPSSSTPGWFIFLDMCLASYDRHIHPVYWRHQITLLNS